MARRDQHETKNAQPTDEGLVDYLLGESSDTDTIERWLAVDESHLLRLERLAEVVFAVAADTVVAEVRPANPFVLSSLSDIDTIADSSLSHGSTHGSRVTFGHLMLGLATLAASITFIILWSQNESDQRLPNDRLAVAWAEMVSAKDTTNPLAIELPDAWPVADVDAMAIDTPYDSASGWSIDNEPIAQDELAAGEFASGDDSPPQWLLVAVSQMTEELPIDPANDFDGNALDKEEVR